MSLCALVTLTFETVMCLCCGYVCTAKTANDSYWYHLFFPFDTRNKPGNDGIFNKAVPVSGNGYQFEVALHTQNVTVMEIDDETSYAAPGRYHAWEIFFSNFDASFDGTTSFHWFKRQAWTGQDDTPQSVKLTQGSCDWVSNISICYDGPK